MLILQYNKKYQGEYESLKAIEDTDTLLVPPPLGFGQTVSVIKVKYFIVIDYMNMSLLNNRSSERLGELLADMHLYNFEHDTSLVPFWIFL